MKKHKTNLKAMTLNSRKENQWTFTCYIMCLYNHEFLTMSIITPFITQNSFKVGTYAELIKISNSTNEI